MGVFYLTFSTDLTDPSPPDRWSWGMVNVQIYLLQVNQSYNSSEATHHRCTWETHENAALFQFFRWANEVHAWPGGWGGGEGATCGTCDAAHIRQHVKSILTYSVSLPGFRALLSPYSNSSYVMCDFKKIRKRCVRELFRKKAVTQRECFILRIRLGVEWGGVSFLINLKRTVWLSKLCTYITLIKF